MKVDNFKKSRLGVSPNAHGWGNNQWGNPNTSTNPNTSSSYIVTEIALPPWVIDLIKRLFGIDLRGSLGGGGGPPPPPPPSSGGGNGSDDGGSSAPGGGGNPWRNLPPPDLRNPGRILPNITWGHGGRHVPPGMSQLEVEIAIRNDILQQYNPSVQYFGGIRGHVNVRGTDFVYRANPLPGNRINVGAYFVPRHGLGGTATY